MAACQPGDHGGGDYSHDHDGGEGEIDGKGAAPYWVDYDRT